MKFLRQDRAEKVDFKESLKELLTIKNISPDIIGVRSVVCEGFDRNNGLIKAHLIKELKEELYR